MDDSRFTTRADTMDELLRIVDVDDLEDLELVLLNVYPTLDALDIRLSGDTGDEIIVWQANHGVGSTFTFPASVIDLARACEASVDYVRWLADEEDIDRPDNPVESAPRDDATLLAALRHALGLLRLASLATQDD